VNIIEIMQTNLGKTNAEIIYELLLSINNGNCSYRSGSKIIEAIGQYNELVDYRVIYPIKEGDISNDVIQ